MIVDFKSTPLEPLALKARVVQFESALFEVRKYRRSEWAGGARAIACRRAMLGSVGHEYAALRLNRRETSKIERVT
jgi:hypothetical protein